MVEFWVWQKVSKQKKMWKEGREKREGARMLGIARVTVLGLSALLSHNPLHIVNAHPQSERLFTASHENDTIGTRESGSPSLRQKNNLHLQLLFVRIFSRGLFRRAVVSGMAAYVPDDEFAVIVMLGPPPPSLACREGNLTLYSTVYHGLSQLLYLLVSILFHKLVTTEGRF
jgi:hypothetical protein